jgi:hypothetical protein
MPASVPLLTRRTCSTPGTRLDDGLGQLDLALGRRAEAEAVERGLLHRLEHGRVAVAQDHRAPGADVVDVALAFGVPDVGALRALDEARRAADGAEGAHGRVDAAGDDALGAFEQGLVAVAHGLGFSVGGVQRGKSSASRALAVAAAGSAGASPAFAFVGGRPRTAVGHGMAHAGLEAGVQALVEEGQRLGARPAAGRRRRPAARTARPTEVSPAPHEGGFEALVAPAVASTARPELPGGFPGTGRPH